MEIKVMLLFLVLYCDFLSARAEEPRMVFAHYMLYYPDSVETLKKEIQLAYSKGIDAFALNFNKFAMSWPDRVKDMFQAANESGTPFKLFFSADMHDPLLSNDDLKAMLTNYSGDPSHLKYNGKAFFSAWLGADTPWSQILESAGGRDKFFFVPFFPTGGTYGEVQTMLNEHSDVLDGLFAWDTSAWPYDASNLNNPPSGTQDQNYLKACSEKGKVYMASPSPWFFKNLKGTSCSDAKCQVDKNINECNCQVKGNYEGPGLWIEKWKQLVSLKPPLLEIVTWNDWAESSYVVPPYNEAAKDYGADTFNHAAFLELSEHYIRWYKSGQEPALAEEAVYLFYYTQPKSLRGTSDGGAMLRADSLTDNVYVTTALKSTADVLVTSGGTSKTFPAEVGINTYSMPFQVGKQAFVLKRGDVVVFTVNGDKDVTDFPPVNANLNVYSTCTKCNYA